MLSKQRVNLGLNMFPHFFGAWSSVSKDLCDDLITFFENHPELHRSGKIAGGKIDHDIKKSTDIRVDPLDLESPQYEIFNRYFTVLNKCYQDYCDQWNFLNTFISKIHIGSFNLQKYLPGEHFSGIHAERTSLTHLHRILVWMTYLNDIEDSGETEFPHYDLKVEPRTGLTLIWPAEWTHAHRGNPTLVHDKFIITGWFHLAE